ncbi:hypothetical protein [Cysteiniphilum sp. QT6929]|uniref:hypothetical protein n=1 Tax=Cysteiniphilum sp. QT6929 TaxID=2975055 RepID=UPI0024B3A89D|nr:hypothetical protein [Cysteiniphilum sp. QT6929]WHN65113.1 hypothetical protein NYP54_08685 [Cysteiniphilum sp. QT6929]
MKAKMQILAITSWFIRTVFSSTLVSVFQYTVRKMIGEWCKYYFLIKETIN